MLEVIFEYFPGFGQPAHLEQVIPHRNERFVAKIIGRWSGALELGMARQCGLKQPEANTIIEEVRSAVANWRASATAHGLTARDIARMASAFEDASRDS